MTLNHQEGVPHSAPSLLKGDGGIMTFTGGLRNVRNRIAAVGLASISLVALSTSLHAQAVPQVASASALAINLAVPAGPLEAGLLNLGRQANLRLVYPSEITRGKRTGGVAGSLSPAEALSRVLAGTGLAYRFTSANTVTIVDPQTAENNGTVAADGSLVLDTIDVQGRISGAFGEENRFVAADARTATKISEPIKNIPYSVSVVTQDQIESTNAQTTTEALRYAPGVRAGTSDGDRRQELGDFSIRGFNPVALLDGQRLDYNVGRYSAGISVDPYLLDRIEVLGGPASVIYGQSSPGGAVSFMTKRPEIAPINEVFFQTGSHGRIEGGFDIGRSTEDEVWSYRVTGIGLTTGTQVDETRDERLAIAPSITWKPTDSTKLTVLMSYQYDPAKMAQRSLPLFGSLLPSDAGTLIPRDLFIGEPDFNSFNRKQFTAGYEFEHQFNEIFTFRSNGKYFNVDGSYRDIYAGGLQADGRTLDRNVWGTNEDFWSFGIDNQLEAKFDTGPVEHTALFGADYYKFDQYAQSFSGSITPIDIFKPVYGAPIIDLAPVSLGIDSDLEQNGVYAQDLIKYGNWNLLLGVRYDCAESNLLFRSSQNLENQKDDAFTWRAGLSYAFESGITPYFSYSTSFQPTAGTTAEERGAEPFKPTTGEQYEVGVKYQPPGLSSFFTLAAFDIRQQNVLTGDPIYAWQSIQTGEVRSRGITASATLSLADNVDLVASYTYLNLETTKATVDQDNNVIGNTPWYEPSHVASIWGTYRFTEGALDGLTVGGGVRYVGSSYNDNLETYEIPAYTLVDAALKYDFGAKRPDWKGLEAQLNVSNLLNEKYTTCNGGSCWYGDGRAFKAQLKYRW